MWPDHLKKFSGAHLQVPFVMLILFFIINNIRSAAEIISWNSKEPLPGRGHPLRSSSSNSGSPCVTSPRYCWCCCIWLCCACWSAETAGECDAESPDSPESNLAAGFNLQESRDINEADVDHSDWQNHDEKWCCLIQSGKQVPELTAISCLRELNEPVVFVLEVA